MEIERPRVTQPHLLCDIFREDFSSHFGDLTWDADCPLCAEEGVLCAVMRHPRQSMQVASSAPLAEDMHDVAGMNGNSREDGAAGDGSTLMDVDAGDDEDMAGISSGDGSGAEDDNERKERKERKANPRYHWVNIETGIGPLLGALSPS